MTAINFDVLIAVGFKPRTSQLYTPVFCATEGNVAIYIQKEMINFSRYSVNMYGLQYISIYLSRCSS